MSKNCLSIQVAITSDGSYTFEEKTQKWKVDTIKKGHHFFPLSDVKNVAEIINGDASNVNETVSLQVVSRTEGKRWFYVGKDFVNRDSLKKLQKLAIDGFDTTFPSIEVSEPLSVQLVLRGIAKHLCVTDKYYDECLLLDRKETYENYAFDCLLLKKITEFTDTSYGTALKVVMKDGRSYWIDLGSSCNKNTSELILKAQKVIEHFSSV